jgi:hypothetical protein
MATEREELREALIRVAVALKQGDLPFALAGGYAVWVRGGPESLHDVDFLVDEDDRARALELLAEAGLEVEHPSEDWLVKVRVDGAVVDVIFRAAGAPSAAPAIAAATEEEVLSVFMPVLTATDLMLQKTSVLSERYCDLATVLGPARAMREHVDWERVRRETAENPFAEAFLLLLEPGRDLDAGGVACARPVAWSGVDHRSRPGVPARHGASPAAVLRGSCCRRRRGRAAAPDAPARLCR